MLEENMANWEENWKEQYIDQGRGLLLRDLLEDRFGSLPDSVTSYIDKSSDSDALRKFALFAIQAESLQSVIDRIKVMTGSDCTGQTVQPA